MDRYEVLKRYFGHFEFRDGQNEIIDNILRGKDVLAIMPTGAGKSICYQVPAMLLEGITVVISPLVSLMQDQVSALVQSGVNAAYINSSLTKRQLELVYQRAGEGRYKIIYAAPERLTTEPFLRLAQKVNIAMVTVDEAHCVSQWGQDFRPSYLKICEFIDTINYRPIISAFTATATSEVKRDIAEILRLNNPFTIVTGFDRKNLYFEVQKPKSRITALIDIVIRNKDKSGIIYCNTRKNVEEVCVLLEGRGYNATRYHAGLSDEERNLNQQDFIYDRKNIMVATNAFGMGINKSNVSYVVHYNMPKSIEAYYQEAGRAGRDGEEAECVLLYSPQDVRINRFLIENSSEENDELSDEQRQFVLDKNIERLKYMTFYATTKKCLRKFILRYFGEYISEDCKKCSVCDNVGVEEVRAVSPVSKPPTDTTLLVRLKTVRSRIAKSTHMPAYIIFSDATLRDMCDKKPIDNEGMLNVNGVGKHKLESYGDYFIAEIKKYLQEVGR